MSYLILCGRKEGLREKGKLERQGRAVFWHLECSLARLEQPAGVKHRLRQPGEGNLPQEEEKKAQPRQLCVALALSVDSICAT